MSGGACAVVIMEALKLKAPSPMLEQCLRQVCGHPLVIERLGPDSPVWQLGVLPQWDKDDQLQVQAILREIVETDLPGVELP